MTEATIIFIREKEGSLFVRRLGLVCIIVGFWSLGYYAGSPALEWAGVVFGIITVFAFAAAFHNSAKERGRMTAAEARAWLDQEFPQ